MDNPDGRHGLASWIRQPESTSALVTVVGLNLLVASMFVPVGITNLALTLVGTTCLVVGALTLLLQLCGRVLRLNRRATRVMASGRSEILLPGTRPPQMHVRSRQPMPVPDPVIAGQAEPPAIDLTEPRPGRIPQQAGMPADRPQGSAV